MRQVVRHIAGVAAALMLGLAWVGGNDAAQGQTGDVKQIKLTEQMVKNFIAAQKELTAIADELQKAGDKPDPKLQSKIDGIAKKNGFANFNDLDDVAANVSMVMAGLDPQSGEYTDPAESIKAEMAEIKKDTTIPEKDKKQMIDEMTEALKTTPPLQFKENIALIKKHHKEIEAALGTQ